MKPEKKKTYADKRSTGKFGTPPKRQKFMVRQNYGLQNVRYDSLTHVKAQPSEFKGASKFCIRSAVNRF